MAKKSKIHPQFFHTLAPDFHAHLMIPEDFYIKYIEGTTNTDKNSVELKFEEASDITWKVKASGRKLSDGWEEFAVANNFEIGDVVVVQYVGELVFKVFDYGPNYSANNGTSLAKKRLLCPRDFSSEDENDMEFSRKKRLKKNDAAPAETESFVASVTSSNDTMVSCSKESLIEIERKRHPPYSSYSPCRKQTITVTLPRDYVRIERLSLPAPFLRDNGINKPCKMYLSDYHGKKWPTNLKQDNKGTMRLGVGWKDFIKANGLNTGKSFGLKLTWEDTTPVLSLCPAESRTDRGAAGGCSTTNQRDSSPSNQNPFVTLRIARACFKKSRLVIPAQFARENSLNKPGMMICLSRKDGTKWFTTLLQDKDRRVSLGRGWKEFAQANNLKSGQSLKVELTWQDATPMLSLVRSITYSACNRKRKMM